MIFNEEQQLFRDTAREFAEMEIAPLIPHIIETSMMPEGLYGRAADLGLVGIMLPEEAGGAGLGQTEASIVLEEISKVCPGLALSFERAIVSGCILRNFEALSEKYLAGVADGSLRVGLGSASGSGEKTALLRKVEGGWRAYGACHFVANCDGELVGVYGFDEEGTMRLAWFEKGWDGVGMTAVGGRFGQAGGNGGMVALSDAFVPAENVVAADEALRIADAISSCCSVASALGCAEGLFARTIDFCTTRTNSGIRLTEFASVRANLAELRSKIVVCEAAVYDCAHHADACAASDGTACAAGRERAAAVRIRVADMLVDVMYECIKLNGGMGYHDPNLWRYLADGLDYCLADDAGVTRLESLACLMGL